MKLTLRTLIAFLDGTMNEEDTATFRKKVRESESIRTLIQRIKEVVAQRRAPAPKIDSRGLGGDPNSSAEYIDSTLDPERVAEFEKLAIGSDILLAEISQVHQILAQLSSIDEGISGRLRNRLYKTAEGIYQQRGEEPETFPVIEDHASIVEEYDDADPLSTTTRHAFALSPPVGPPMTFNAEQDTTVPPLAAPPVQSASNGRKPLESAAESPVDRAAGQPPRTMTPTTDQVPGPHSPGHQRIPLKPLPIIMATSCVIALVVLIAISFFPPSNNRVAQDDPTTAEESSEAVAESPDPIATGADTSLDPEQAAESSDTDADSDPAVASGTDEPNDWPDPTTRNAPPAAPNEPAVDQQPTEEKVQKDADEARKAVEDEPEEVLNLFRDKDYSGADKPAKAEPGNMKPDDKVAAGKAPPEETPPAQPTQPAPQAADLTAPKDLMTEAVALTNGPPVGILKSAFEPTLRKTNLPEAKWIQLAQEQSVHVNDTLVALPDCRPQIELGESVRLTLYGLSRLTLRTNEGEVLPLPVIDSGIVGFENLAAPNTSVDVSLAGKKIQVTLVDDTSQFVVVYHRPPESSSETAAVQLAAVKGRLICKFDGEVVSLEPRNMLCFQADSHEAVPFATQPDAMESTADTLTTSAKEILFALGLDNPVFDVAARKGLADQRSYVRHFAATSLLSLGDHGAFIRFLDDEPNQAFWEKAIQFARQQTFADPLFRQSLREFCQSPVKEGSDGDGSLDPQATAMWQRMLTVHADQQLQAGLGRELIDALDHPELWLRVTAIQTLFDLTGKTKFYRPEDRPEKRQKWVKAWEKELQEGKLQITQPIRIQRFR